MSVSVPVGIDPTTITMPESDVPGVGPNPSSNPGGLTPPTASNPNQPVVPPVSGPVTGVTPPTGNGGNEVKPQNYTYGVDGKCYYDPFNVGGLFGLLQCKPDNLGDAQTKIEAEQAKQTGDLNELVAFGQGLNIRARVYGAPSLSQQDKDNLDIIDQNLMKMSARERVDYRARLEHEIAQCGGNPKCVSRILERQVASTTAGARLSEDKRTAGAYWGNNPKSYMSPEQKFAYIRSGANSAVKWNEKHYDKNTPSLKHVLGYSHALAMRLREPVV